MILAPRIVATVVASLALLCARSSRAQSASGAPAFAPGARQGDALPRAYTEGVYIDGDCPNHTRCICLTFDDGPGGPLTRELLDILDQHHVHATFFVEGQHLDTSDRDHQTNRETLREARRRGHLVGNHTYHHYVMNRLDDRQLAFELDRTSDLIAEVLGERPGFFRAPYGMLGTVRAIRAVVHRGYTTVRWRLDPRDWAEHSASAVLRNFRYQLHIHPQGGILLMHDVHPSTIAAVPLILDEIERRNRELAARHEPIFEFVTLDAFYRPRSRRHAR